MSPVDIFEHYLETRQKEEGKVERGSVNEMRMKWDFVFFLCFKMFLFSIYNTGFLTVIVIIIVIPTDKIHFRIFAR